MNRTYAALVGLAIAVAAVRVAHSASLIDSLGEELKVMRSLPVGSPTHGACPKSTKSLVGLGQRQVREVLGMPDFVERTGSWTYFFTSPVPEGQRGGGFPVLIFTFDRNALVGYVFCHHDR